MRASRSLVAPLVAAAGLVAWGALASIAPLRRAVPTPAEMAATTWEALTHATLWHDAGATLARVIAGVTLASVVGLLAGVACGQSARGYERTAPALDFIRSVPPVLMFPLGLMLLGYGEPARVVTIAAGTWGIVAVEVAAALRHAPAAREEVLRVAGVSPWTRFWRVRAYELLPGLFMGVRMALAAGMIVAVVGEMLVGVPHGLGARALDAQIAGRPDLLWLVIAASGLLGTALSRLVARIERRVVRWR